MQDTLLVITASGIGVLKVKFTGRFVAEEFMKDVKLPKMIDKDSI